jgi:hypothetical protein
MPANYMQGLLFGLSVGWFFQIVPITTARSPFDWLTGPSESNLAAALVFEAIAPLLALAFFFVLPCTPRAAAGVALGNALFYRYRAQAYLQVPVYQDPQRAKQLLAAGLGFYILWIVGAYGINAIAHPSLLDSSRENVYAAAFSVMGLIVLLCDVVPFVLAQRPRRGLAKVDRYPPAILGNDLQSLPVRSLSKTLERLVRERKACTPPVLLWVFHNCFQWWAIQDMLASQPDQEFVWLVESLLANDEWNSDAWESPATKKSHVEGSSEPPPTSRSTWLQLFVGWVPEQRRGDRLMRMLQPCARTSRKPLSPQRALMLLHLNQVLSTERLIQESEKMESPTSPQANQVLYESLESCSSVAAAGAAIRRSWKLLARLARVSTEETLREYKTEEEKLPDHVPVPEARQNMLSLLARAEGIIAQAQGSFDMSSQFERQRALLRASSQARALQSEMPVPIPIVEYRIFRRAVQRWPNLFAAIAEKEAKAPVRLENPYRAGDPVTGSRFFDREQILNLLRTRTQTGQSLLLIGHRRSGKTSILMELSARVTDQMLATYVTMERLAVAESAKELVYSILQRAATRAREVTATAPELPPLEEFESKFNPAMDRFLEELLRCVAPRHIVICLDEYEILEEEIEDGNYRQREIAAFLRAIEGNSRLSLIAGGRLGPVQLQQRFGQPVFARLEPVWVDLLPESDARQLITNPIADFPVNYDAEVVNRICALTAGQPYLIQQICKDLLDQLQEQVRLDQGRGLLIRMADLEGVLGAKHFEKASYYYQKVWEEVGETGRSVLEALAVDDNRGRTQEELQALANGSGKFHAILEELKDQRIISYSSSEGRYTFRIPLMCQWVRDRAAAGQRAS